MTGAKDVDASPDAAGPSATLSFEQQTYEYARSWARLSRRGVLQGAAAAAFLAATMPFAHAQKPGGTLRIARGQESDTLDPQKTALLVAHEIAWQIYRLTDLP